MKLLRGLSGRSIEPALEAGSVATIGNFDGMHLGHQSIVRHLVEKAKELSLPSVVIIFEPQPQEFFVPDKAPARIMRFREKYFYLERLGIDYLLCLSFNQKLAGLSAEEFVEIVIRDRLKVKYIVVGDDFTFGRERSGNYEFLEKWGKSIGFDVQDTKSVVFGDERVSSTLIRQHLADSDFGKAEKLLGRPFEFIGKVCYGQQLGRTLGIPTINLPIARKKTPVHGVFVVEVTIYEDGVSEDESYQGVCNLGTRPTVNGKGVLLEVHLFDFDRDIYGKTVSVRPLKKIRNEEKFPDIETMKKQIMVDIEKAKSFFKNQ